MISWSDIELGIDAPNREDDDQVQTMAWNAWYKWCVL